jgi:hypothetical protein
MRRSGRFFRWLLFLSTMLLFGIPMLILEFNGTITFLESEVGLAILIVISLTVERVLSKKLEKKFPENAKT